MKNNIKNLQKPPLNVYIIIGDPKTRKSATICALTGIRGRNNLYEIQLINGNIIKVYIRTNSLQEGKDIENPQRISPKDFIKLINTEREKENFDYILISLHIDGVHGKKHIDFPDGINYINEFRNEGWNIIRIEILAIPITDNTSLLNLVNSLSFYSINNIQLYTGLFKPTNAIAADIRKGWGWM